MHGMTAATSQLSSTIVLADEVERALRDGLPVVALESTIIAHGLPRPRNLEVALELEKVLRDAGVVPATIAVIAGVPRVGLDAEQLDRIAGKGADPAAGEAIKASLRDLPVAMAKGADAATTVAATAFLAHRAGIRVFATGGLGGVHREASRTFDESADLTVLGRTPITVVSAGVKSVLDVAATLERLETLGITVVGYRTHRFPGFYVTDSGHALEWRVDDPSEVVAIMRAADRLGTTGAIVVANPVAPDRQLDPGLHDRALAGAIAAAETGGIHGKDVTPLLLDHIQRVTGGASLEANINAVRGNVTVAASIATAWAGAAR